MASDPGVADAVIRNVGTIIDGDGRAHALDPTDFRFAQFGLVTWWGARAWAENLNYGGYDDWRLPAASSTAQSGFNQTDTELGHLFYVGLGGEPSIAIDVQHNGNFDLFAQLPLSNYWFANESPLTPAPEPGYAWNFNTRDGYQNGGSLKDNYFRPWAVRSGDVGNVPVPASLGLLTSGLLTLIRLTRRTRG